MSLNMSDCGDLSCETDSVSDGNLEICCYVKIFNKNDPGKFTVVTVYSNDFASVKENIFGLSSPTDNNNIKWPRQLCKDKVARAPRKSIRFSEDCFVNIQNFNKKLNI